MTPKELHDELKRLAEKATPGPWHVGENPVIRGSIEVDGSVDTYSGPVRSSIAHFDLVEATDGDGRHWYAAGDRHANVALTVSLRNNLPTLLSALLAAEAVEGARVALKAHDAFWQKVREHDGQCTENDFWDWSLELGLMRTEPYDPAKHGENDCDLEPGDDWHMSTNLARSALSQLDQLEAAGK